MNHQIYNTDCISWMKQQPPEFIDLTVTSPPYDNIRDYHGYTFDYEQTLQELLRITKLGGVCVWIVGDQTYRGGESGTSFRQALHAQSCGWTLHDTMIWQKPGFSYAGGLNVRYGQVFEYMFVFSRGRVKTFNPLKDRKNKHTGIMPKTKRLSDGTVLRLNKKFTQSEYGIRFNVWLQSPQSQRGDSAHPAAFPLQLVKDHIVSWSNEGDTVYDPFSGSGTTVLAARQLNRVGIGTEISPEYCELAKRRLHSGSTYDQLFSEE